MAKRDLPFIDNLCEESRRLYDIFNEEKSDLAVVLISTSFIEAWLTVILRVHLISSKKLEEKEINELFDKNYGLLNTLSNKTKLAYFLSLIDGKIFNNLEMIRKIRNKFAHTRLDIRFSDETIRLLCERLNYISMTAISNNESIPTIEFLKTARGKFVINVAFIVERLSALGRKFQDSKN